MSAFPETPTTLLTRLAARADGTDEASWARFFELYQPAMVRFVEGLCRNGAAEADDIVQEVLVRLVKILQEGRYDRTRARFHAFLSSLLRNELYSAIRRARVRPEGYAQCRPEDLSSETASVDGALCVPELTEEVLDAQWRQDRHAAAVAHVFAHTALSEQSKRIFRELEETGDSCKAVALRLGVAPATVRQVKSRVTRLVSALEKLTQ